MAVQAGEERFVIDVDGRSITALPGQTVAAALIAAGITSFRHTASGHARGLFCGMGVCYDCCVTVDDLPDQRACMTVARPGMRVRTGVPLPLSAEEAHARA